MKFIKSFFNKHIQDQNTSYTKHCRFGLRAGFVLIVAGVASIVHAILPGVLANFSEKCCRDLLKENELQNKK
jgi:hypothetical protein